MMTIALLPKPPARKPRGEVSGSCGSLRLQAQNRVTEIILLGKDQNTGRVVGELLA